VHGDLAESLEADLALISGVVLGNNGGQLVVVVSLADGVQDGADLDAVDEARLGGVEHLECLEQHLLLLVIIFHHGAAGDLKIQKKWQNNKK